jgi:hypothetical protein
MTPHAARPAPAPAPAARPHASNASADTDAANTIWMSVSFDVDQYGDTLSWIVTEDARNAMQQTGVFAGSLHFEKSAPVGFRVRCWGGADLASFQALSAVLATLPARADLPVSPFQGVDTATYTLGDFAIVQGPPTLDPATQRYYLETWVGPTAKTVDVDGGWQLKMVLTAQFTTGADGAATTKSRAFYFDPESQVGNGTR